MVNEELEEWVENNATICQLSHCAAGREGPRETVFNDEF